LTAKWDIGIWTGSATGEENTNSLAEAQIWTAGFFLGRRITSKSAVAGGVASWNLDLMLSLYF
jgi:hypothetical protein